MRKVLFPLMAFLLFFACKKETSPDLLSEEIASKSAKPNKKTDVTIGTQIWMLKNLDVSTYRNGDAIPQVTDPTEWASLTTGAWCYYDNDPANGEIYGKLYNWYAVNDPRGLAPKKYHVPSLSELTTLTDFLGGANVAGGKMKEAGTILWLSPNTDATNSSGFTGLPGGSRNSNGEFGSNIKFFGYVWSSTLLDPGIIEGRWLDFTSACACLFSSQKAGGYSIRCVRD